MNNPDKKYSKHFGTCLLSTNTLFLHTMLFFAQPDYYSFLLLLCQMIFIAKLLIFLARQSILQKDTS